MDMNIAITCSLMYDFTRNCHHRNYSVPCSYITYLVVHVCMCVWSRFVSVCMCEVGYMKCMFMIVAERNNYWFRGWYLRLNSWWFTHRRKWRDPKQLNHVLHQILHPQQKILQLIARTKSWYAAIVHRVEGI